jgi:hypothetical protein
MSILDKIISNKNNVVIDPNKLNKQELELLLIVIKNTTIKGEQVEVFYNLIIKLQNQHTQL